MSIILFQSSPYPIAFFQPTVAHLIFSFCLLSKELAKLARHIHHQVWQNNHVMNKFIYLGKYLLQYIILLVPILLYSFLNLKSIYSSDQIKIFIIYFFAENILGDHTKLTIQSKSSRHEPSSIINKLFTFKIYY